MRALAVFCLALLLSHPALAGGPEVLLTLLHVNDVYQVGPVDKGSRGGLARVAALKQRIQKESPHTLLLLGGDTLSPSVASNTFKGAQMIATWNAAGLDLAVLGNHEFDFGPDVLQARLGESRFRWLGANVKERATGRQLPGVAASEIRSFDGIKVGFLGVITESTAQSSRPGKGVRFLDPVATARQEAARLRARGARVIVALTHLNLQDDRRLAASGAVDLILGGHEHAVLQSLAGHAPILKAGSDARNAARVDLVLDGRSGRLKHLDWEMLPVGVESGEDPATARVVAGFEAQLSALLDLPAGESRVALDARQESSRTRETNLGNWLADIYRSSTGADVAILNGGSIRSNAIWGPGRISKRDILTILPFENPIVKLEVSGRILRQALEHGLAMAAETKEAGRFPQVSGVRFSFDPRRPAGKRLVEASVGGTALEDERRYSLAVNGYLASGGDGYTMLQGQAFLIAPENALSETAEVIESLTRLSPVSPQTDGRIQRLNSP